MVENAKRFCNLFWCAFACIAAGWLDVVAGLAELAALGELPGLVLALALAMALALSLALALTLALAMALALALALALVPDGFTWV